MIWQIGNPARQSPLHFPPLHKGGLVGGFTLCARAYLRLPLWEGEVSLIRMPPLFDKGEVVQSTGGDKKVGF